MLAAPLTDPAEINRRASITSIISSTGPLARRDAPLPAPLPDIARALSRITLGRADRAISASIGNGLAEVPSCARLCCRMT